MAVEQQPFLETFLSTENPGNSRFNSAPSDYLAATSNDLRIGASANGDTPGEFFSGVIQDVAVYDRALDFKDIVSHYSVFATGYPFAERWAYKIVTRKAVSCR